MADVGLTSDFVDTQDVSLTNVTDNLTYKKLTDVILDMNKNLEKNQLTDNTVDNLYSLFMNGIEGNIRLTTLELDAWTALFISSETKVWQVSYTDADNDTKSISFNAEVKTFRLIDFGLGWVNQFFRLESDEVVTVV